MRGIFRRGDVLAGAFLLSILASLFTFVQISRSVDGALWSSVSVVQVEKTKDITIDTYNTAPAIPCEDQEFSWKSRTSGWVSSIVTTKYTRCAVAMADAYFETGTTTQGRIRSYSSSDKTFGTEFPSLANVRVYAVPNTYSLVVQSWAYQNFQSLPSGLHIIKDYRLTMDDTGPDGATNKIYRPTKPFDFELRGPDGSLVSIHANGVKFSSDGKWMIFRMTYGGNLTWARLNLETYEVFAFATPTQTQAAVYNAISNDGRYVVLYEPQSNLRIYDLEKCNSGSNKFLSQQCEYLSLYDDVKAGLGVNEIQFRNLVFKGGNRSISAYIMSRKTGQSQWGYGEYLLRYGDEPTTNGYLAMGDSFSSGEGAYDYRSQTDFYIDESQYNLCHQSRSSYPYLLNKTIGFDWFGSVACSGAEREHITGVSQAKTNILSNEAVYSNFLPGYLGQKNFLAENNSSSPKVATLTIAGNDIGFADIIGRCAYIPGACYGERSEREQLANLVDQQIKPLTELLQKLKTQSIQTDFRLYVIGYPNIISPDGSCGLNVGLSYKEQQFAHHLIEYFNRAITLAAGNAGVRYVNISDALTEGVKDYRLCGDQDTLAVNGVVLFGTTSKKPDKPYYQESYHPNLLGHALIARKINQETSSLAVNMPAQPNIAQYKVESAYRIALVEDNEKFLSERRYIYDQPSIPGMVMRGDSLDFSSKGLKTDAKPGAKVTFEIHSTPIKIGEGVVDTDGYLTGLAIIPPDIMPGYHEIHILYENFFGDLVDRYRIVFAKASTEDFDGDGILNNTDPCIIGDQSGIDNDKDGIDDACDDEYVMLSNPESPPRPTQQELAKQVAAAISIGTSRATSQTNHQNIEVAPDIDEGGTGELQDGKNEAVVLSGMSIRSLPPSNQDRTGAVELWAAISLGILAAGSLIASRVYSRRLDRT